MTGSAFVGIAHPLCLKMFLLADFRNQLGLCFSWWFPYLPLRAFSKEMEPHDGFVRMLCCMALHDGSGTTLSGQAVREGLEVPHAEYMEDGLSLKNSISGQHTN